MTQNFFSFKFSEGLKVGTKVTVDAKIPIVNVGGKVQISGGFSIDAEQSWTKTETETFSDSITIHVPPNTSVEATATLSTQQGKFTFRGTATATATRAGVLTSFKLKGNQGFTEWPILLGILLPSEEDGQAGVGGTLDYALAINVTVSTNPLQARASTGG